MNDRYLFRAKRMDKGGWIDGCLTVMWGQLHIINPNNENTAYPIDETTICQCSGLRDKNGKMIWENDIVKPFADLKGIVRFGERDYSREFGFNIEWMSKSCYSRDFLYWAEKCKVIGSAIDNPELLEQEG